MKTRLQIQDNLLYPEIIWQLPLNIYKRQRGKILIIGGSSTMVGAPVLACEAAFRSGCGVVVLAYPEAARNIFKHLLPETMSLPLPSTKSGSVSLKALEVLEKKIRDFDVIGIGPGLSANPETQEFIWKFIFKTDLPLVIDADALSALALGFSLIKEKEKSEGIEKFLKKKEKKTIITPHPGEALKLIKATRSRGEFLKITSVKIDKEKEKFAPFIANKSKMITVLKGQNTVIAQPSSEKKEGRVVINKTGGPFLATAGTGDVLFGIVTTFFAQNIKKPFEAACTAVYLHGLAGEIAAQNIGNRSIVASDIVKYLGKAFKIIENNITKEVKNE